MGGGRRGARDFGGFGGTTLSSNAPHHARPVLAVLLALVAGLTFPLATPAGATADFGFERIAGHDRFDTARVISAQQGKTSTVVLARGDVFADALAGTYLAGIYGAPILLTRSDGLPAETDQAIDATGATRVLLLGGPNAVSPAVEEHLRSKGLAVERIGGVDRFETSALAARHGGPSVLGQSDGLRTAIVVSGANFPDALSGGPVSFAQHFPTLLTAPGEASPAMLAAIDALEIRQVIIIGGPTAVASIVESSLRSRGLNVNRLYGQDRSGTSVAVARIAIERFGHSPSHLNVARGDDFADALAFTAHAGRDSKAGGMSPLYLTISSTVAGQVLVDAVRAQSANLHHGHIAGGLMALSQAVEDELTRAARAGSAELELDFSTVVPGGVLRGEISGDNIGSLSVSGCGLHGLTVREGAGGFEFVIPATQPPGTCSLTFTTNFTDGSPPETDRRTITVDGAATDGTTTTTTTTQPAPGDDGAGTTTTTTEPGTGTVGDSTTTTQPTSDSGSTTTTTTTTQSTTTTTTEATTTTTTEATTTTTEATTTTTTVPQGTPTITSAMVQDEAPTATASSGDVHQFVFSEAMAASTAAAGSRYTVSSSSGSADVTCGTGGVACALLPAGTYNGAAYPASQVMRVYLPSAMAFGYPATVAAVSPEWTDTGGTTLSPAASADPTLDAGVLTGRPTMISALADQSSDTVTVTYPEGVDCNGVGHAQFTYLELDNPIPQGAQGISCDGSTTVTLNFDDGVIHTGDGNVRIEYRESSVTADRIADLAGQAVTTGETQAATVQA